MNGHCYCSGCYSRHDPRDCSYAGVGKQPIKSHAAYLEWLREQHMEPVEDTPYWELD